MEFESKMTYIKRILGEIEQQFLIDMQSHEPEVMQQHLSHCLVRDSLEYFLKFRYDIYDNYFSIILISSQRDRMLYQSCLWNCMQRFVEIQDLIDS